MHLGARRIIHSFGQSIVKEDESRKKGVAGSKVAASYLRVLKKIEKLHPTNCQIFDRNGWFSVSVLKHFTVLLEHPPITTNHGKRGAAAGL